MNDELSVVILELLARIARHADMVLALVAFVRRFVVPDRADGAARKRGVFHRSAGFDFLIYSY